jgi:uncharacterized protein (DUF1499 family)
MKTLARFVRTPRALAALTLCAVTSCASLAGGRGGVVSGKVGPCLPGPHCVGSDDPDPEKRIAPLRIRGDADAAWRALQAAVAGLPRASIIEADGEYYYVTIKSLLLRFTDHVELLLRRESGEIAMRSSAGFGYYDFEVNRNRLESIRRALQEQGVVE